MHDLREVCIFDPSGGIEAAISAARGIIAAKKYVMICHGSKSEGFESQQTVSSLEALAEWEGKISEVVLKKGRLP